MAIESVLFTHLTEADFEAFHAHRVRYSAHVKPSEAHAYPATRSYIATFLTEFPAAMEALGWKNVLSESRDGQLHIRKLRRHL